MRKPGHEYYKKTRGAYLWPVPTKLAECSFCHGVKALLPGFCCVLTRLSRYYHFPSRKSGVVQSIQFRIQARSLPKAFKWVL